MENDSIVFTDEDGNEVAFSVMELTTLGGVNYLLVQKMETMRMMVLS